MCNGFQTLLATATRQLYHGLAEMRKYFFGVMGGIEPSLTDSQSVVLPLHYRHRSRSMMVGLCGPIRTGDLVCPRHARYHCATHRDIRWGEVDGFHDG